MTAAGELARCVDEGIWALDLTGQDASAHVTYEVALSSEALAPAQAPRGAEVEDDPSFTGAEGFALY